MYEINIKSAFFIQFIKYMYKIIEHPQRLTFIEFYNINDFHVILSNYGASIYQIDTVDKRGDLNCVTLSPLLPKYYRNPGYYGLTVGRVAGRLPKADGVYASCKLQCEPNEGDHLLHSGSESMSYKFYDYSVEEKEDRTIVTFSLNMFDYEDGFPGKMDINVIYTLYEKEDKISLEYQAMSTEDTLLCLTNHSYFNLSGNLKTNILNHTLSISKKEMIKMDDNLLPLEIVPVSQEFDFRKPKLLKNMIYNPKIQSLKSKGFDHIYTGKDESKLVLEDSYSGRRLTVLTDYPDILIYSNNFPKDTIFTNEVYDELYLGLAIEPTRYSKVLTSDDHLLLKKNALYNYHISYQFEIMEEEND